MDIYDGNDFSIDRLGGGWEIWRYCDDQGNRERLILTDRAEFYPEDRRVANASPAG